MEIIEYKDIYKQDFINLNLAWINKYFKVEEEDTELIHHIDELLLNGSMIYFVVENNFVLATCMVQPLGNHVWEICKLATNEKYTRNGAGSFVFKACFDYAKEHQAKQIILITNTILKPAMSLYHKFGFKEKPLEPQYEKLERANIQFEYNFEP